MRRRRLVSMQSRSWAWACAWVMVCWSVAGVAAADWPRERWDEWPAPEPTPGSRSVGLPWQGALEGGVLLRPSADVRYIGPRLPAEHFYGTDALVGLIADAAAQVGATLPGAQLVSGDLGRRGGGPIEGHHSHQAGRDADLAFYMSDARGQQFIAPRFLVVRAGGRVRGAPAGVRFDAARNWALVEAMLED